MLEVSWYSSLDFEADSAVEWVRDYQVDYL